MNVSTEHERIEEDLSAVRTNRPDCNDALENLLLRIIAISNPVGNVKIGLPEPRSKIEKLLAAEVDPRVSIPFLRRNRRGLGRVPPNGLAAFCPDYSQN